MEAKNIAHVMWASAQLEISIDALSQAHDHLAQVEPTQLPTTSLRPKLKALSAQIKGMKNLSKRAKELMNAASKIDSPSALAEEVLGLTVVEDNDDQEQKEGPDEEKQSSITEKQEESKMSSFDLTAQTEQDSKDDMMEVASLPTGKQANKNKKKKAKKQKKKQEIQQAIDNFCLRELSLLPNETSQNSSGEVTEYEMRKSFRLIVLYRGPSYAHANVSFDQYMEMAKETKNGTTAVKEYALEIRDKRTFYRAVDGIASAQPEFKPSRSEYKIVLPTPKEIKGMWDAYQGIWTFYGFTSAIVSFLLVLRDIDEQSFCRFLNEVHTF